MIYAALALILVYALVWLVISRPERPHVSNGGVIDDVTGRVLTDDDLRNNIRYSRKPGAVVTIYDRARPGEREAK